MCVRLIAQSNFVKTPFSMLSLCFWSLLILFNGGYFGDGYSIIEREGRNFDNDLLNSGNFPENITGREVNYFRVNFNNETQLRGLRMPCSCINGECGCCSGNILQNFNINLRQHLCINLTYEPEDFSLGVKMSINDLVLLSRRVSGRNPPPLCVNVPRITSIRFCGKFSNVYLVGRNIHACITVETEWNDRTVFSYSFDCVRLGLDGVAILPAEAGGGLPHPVEEEDEDPIEEYDELLENQTTKKPTKKPINKPISTPKPSTISVTTAKTKVSSTTTKKTQITVQTTEATISSTAAAVDTLTALPTTLKPVKLSSPKSSTTTKRNKETILESTTTKRTVTTTLKK